MKTSDIARLLNLELLGDTETEITAAAPLEQAGKYQISFLESAQNLSKAAQSGAGCLVVPCSLRLSGKNLLLSDAPRYDFTRVLALLYPPSPAVPGIHPTALVAESARIHPGVGIGPYVVIEEEATVEDGARIDAQCFLGRGCHIGEQSHLYPRVVLYAGVKIGRRCVLHSGSVLGADGYGYFPHQGRHLKFPQIGTVEIEDEVEIGANSCVDRAALGITRIGKGAKIDNLVQIAHNVQIGEHCLIVAQVGISGSSRIDDRVTLAGQVGVGEHAHIQSGAMVGGQSGVLNNKILRGGNLYWGTPARPMSAIQEQHRLLASLPGMKKDIRDLKEGMDRPAGRRRKTEDGIKDV